MDSIISSTNGETTEGSPPVILTRFTQMPLDVSSCITPTNLSILKVFGVALASALLQNLQRALQPFVTLTNKLTDGITGRPGSSMMLHPCDLISMSLPKITIDQPYLLLFAV